MGSIAMRVESLPAASIRPGRIHEAPVPGGKAQQGRLMMRLGVVPFRARAHLCNARPAAHAAVGCDVVSTVVHMAASPILLQSGARHGTLALIGGIHEEELLLSDWNQLR